MPRCYTCDKTKYERERADDGDDLCPECGSVIHSYSRWKPTSIWHPILLLITVAVIVYACS
jgi:hypothetical protein